jgi:DNA-binding NtrC family response regulator
MARILVIEDDPSTRLLLESRIKDLGHDVIACETGAAGLARAREATFDLFLVDVHLGAGIDGYEVCRRLRMMEQTATSPVVLVSGRVQRREELHLGYEAGCVAYLLKTDMPQLGDVLQAMLRLKALQDDLAGQNRLLEDRNRRLYEERQRGAELEKALRDSGARGQVFRELASGRPDGLLVVDSEGVICAADRGAQDVFGRELLDQHLSAVAPRSGLEAFVRDAVTEIREGLRFDVPAKPGRPSRSVTAVVLPFLREAEASDQVKRCVLLYDAGKRRIVSDLLRLQEHGLLRSEQAQLVEAARRLYTPSSILGNGAAMTAVRAAIGSALQHARPVLLQGEAGTGRLHAARVIHYSGLRSGNFVAIECAALSPDSLEAELFGYLTDAIPSAYFDRPGLVHRAQFGTLLLAEIHMLPLEQQRRIERLLASGEVQRVGATKSEAVETRVIATSTLDLEREVRAGRFLPELYELLRGGLIQLPPLRERREDVVDWARLLTGDLGTSYAVAKLSSEAEDVLSAHDWPNNLPELSSTIERAVQSCFHSNEHVIRVEHLPAALRESTAAAVRTLTLRPMSTPVHPVAGTHRADAPKYVGTGPWIVGLPGSDAAIEVPVSLRDFERLCLICSLARTGGDKLKAARLLSVGKSTFYRKLGKHGL